MRTLRQVDGWTKPEGVERMSRWDGNYKFLTKDCEECQHHKKAGGEDRCYAGIAWKRLVRVEKLRKKEVKA